MDLERTIERTENTRPEKNKTSEQEWSTAESSTPAIAEQRDGKPATMQWSSRSHVDLKSRDHACGSDENTDVNGAVPNRRLGVKTEGFPTGNPSPAPSTLTARTARTTRQIKGAKAFGG